MQHCFLGSLLLPCFSSGAEWPSLTLLIWRYLKNLFSKSKISYWPNFSPSICQNWFEPYVYSFLPWKTKTVIKASINDENFAHLPLVGRWWSLCSRSDQSSLYHQTSSSGVTGFWCHKSFWKDKRDEALVVVNVWGGCLNLTYVWWQRVYLRRHNEPFQWKRASPAVRGFALNHVRSFYFAHPCLSLDLRLTSKPHHSSKQNNVSPVLWAKGKGFLW